MSRTVPNVDRTIRSFDEWVGVLAAVFATGTLLAASELSALWFVGDAGVMTSLRLLGWGSGHMGVTLAVGALAIAVVELARRIRLPTAGAVSLLSMLCAVAPAYLLGVALTEGDWIRRQSYRGALEWGVAGLVCLVVGLGVWVAARHWESRVLRALLAVGGLAANATNSLVLAGLYGEAHLALYLATVLALLGAVCPRRPQGERLHKLRAGAAVAGVAAVLALPFVLPAARSALAARSQGLGPALGVFGKAEPPLLGLGNQVCNVATHPAAKRTALVERPRSVLLVIVDTLRADALPPVRTGDQNFAKSGDTPELDRWLASSYRFEAAHAQASFTRGSMPSLFRSLEPFEDPAKFGEPASVWAKRLGLRPIAVVPQYFLLPVDERSQALVDGFERVEFYTKDAQQELVPLVREVLGERVDQPFFAWVHVYALHSPYWSGDKKAPSRGRAGYRAALRWFDARFGEVLETLDEFGLRDETMVVLAADHGEHLGPTRTGHGDGVSETELHVPLAIHLPSEAGSVVSPLVGNLDIIPTITDAMGFEPFPGHRGRSLLPLVRGESFPERSLYALSDDDAQHALVASRHKLVYTRAHGTQQVFDWLADPTEKRDLSGLDPELEDRLGAQLVGRNPAAFSAALATPEARTHLQDALERAKAPGSTFDLDCVLRAAAVSGDPALLERATALFDETSDLETRLLLSRVLSSRAPSLWQARWDRALTEQLGKPGEAELVDALIRQNFVSKRSRAASQRIADLAREGPSPLLDGWLTLVRRWRRSVEVYHPLFTRILRDRMGGGVLSVPDLELVERVLDNVATLRRKSSPGSDALEQAVLAYVDFEKTSRAAAGALGSVGSNASVSTLMALAEEHPEPRTRQAALRSLAAVDPAQAFHTSVDALKDPLLTADAIQVLARLGDERALPALKRVAKRHFNAWTRAQAKRAMKNLKKKTPK